MAIMAAEMALAGDLGAMAARGKLLDRQRIELGADHHGRPGLGAFVDRRDAMAAEAGDDAVRLRRLQEIDDGGRGLAFLARDLGAAMQPVPQIDEVDHVAVGEEHPHISRGRPPIQARSLTREVRRFSRPDKPRESRGAMQSRPDAASAVEFGVDFGVEGLGQHGAAGLGLLARGIERDMRHDLGQVAQGEIDRGHQAQYGLPDRKRWRRATKRDDLTHGRTHTEGESGVSVRAQFSESG